MSEKKVVRFNLLEMVRYLLLSGVNPNLLRDSMIHGGLTEHDVDMVFSEIEEAEANRLVNTAYQYLDEIRKEIESVRNLLG